MKDLHSHLLFGIDDGCRDISESVRIIEQAAIEGVTDIMITPHYIEDSKYNCNNKKKEELFNELQKEVKAKKININLYLGNEVYINDNLLKQIKNKEIKTLNNSKYLLIEFPMGNMFYNTKDIIYELIVNGYVPILAHPERYRIFQRHPEYMEEFLRMGLLLQGNYKSLFGKYGKSAKKTLKYFLKKGWITFIGSDIHHEEKYDAKKTKKKLKSIVKNDIMVKGLIEDNFDKVINNLDIGIRR